MNEKDEKEELNLESEHFDPLQALKSDDEIKLPTENAKLFNNLNEYERKSFPGKFKLQKSVNKEDLIEEEGKKRIFKCLKVENEGEKEERQIQIPKRKTLKTVVSKMNDNTNGPLSLLFKGVGHRIRILLRRRKLVIDGCSQFAVIFGNLIAFDKHCNIILKDVKELVKINKINEETRERQRSIGTLFVRGCNIVIISLLQ